ncbi:hypothetical protein C8R44DRAFT_746987 [Mycena epipterygia]|nr:hypothetical protein C8R44DRAFT_746987 [Mycena epipterygia]
MSSLVDEMNKEYLWSLAGHSSFHVKIDMTWLHRGKKEVSHDGARHLLESWLFRTKAHPLSLGFNFPFTPLPPSLMSFITAFSKQIQRLELHLPETQSRPVLSASFPRLRHLATSRFTQEDQRNLLESAPPLRELRLPGKTCTLNASLPLLQSLEMDLHSMKAFMDILTNFPLLAHLKCCIESEHSETDIAAEGSRPVFPHLLSLALRDEPGVLDLVTLPNLCALELPDFTEREDVGSFVACSSCAIRRVAFAISEEIEEEALIGWFQLFPALEALEIRDCHNLALLIDCIDRPSMFLNLKDITVSSVRSKESPPLDYDALIDMLRNRSKSRSCILDIRDVMAERPNAVQYEWFPGNLATEELEDLIANGLNFRIKVQSSLNHSESWSDPSRSDSFLFNQAGHVAELLSSQNARNLTRFPRMRRAIQHSASVRFGFPSSSFLFEYRSKFIDFVFRPASGMHCSRK